MGLSIASQRLNGDFFLAVNAVRCKNEAGQAGDLIIGISGRIMVVAMSEYERFLKMSDCDREPCLEDSYAIWEGFLENPTGILTIIDIVRIELIDFGRVCRAQEFRVESSANFRLPANGFD